MLVAQWPLQQDLALSVSMLMYNVQCTLLLQPLQQDLVLSLLMCAHCLYIYVMYILSFMRVENLFYKWMCRCRLFGTGESLTMSYNAYSMVSLSVD